jgi:hypothetical protein
MFQLPAIQSSLQHSLMLGAEINQVCDASRDLPLQLGGQEGPTWSMHSLEGIIEGAFVPLFLTIFTVHEATVPLVAPTNVLMGLYSRSASSLFHRQLRRLYDDLGPALRHDASPIRERFRQADCSR